MEVRIKGALHSCAHTDPTCGVITAADNLIAAYVETSYTRRVAIEYTEHDSLLYIPYPQSRVPRARHGDRAIVQYPGAPDCGSVPAKDVNTVTRCQ
jgi:hypothetical protein